MQMHTSDVAEVERPAWRVVNLNVVDLNAQAHRMNVSIKWNLQTLSGIFPLHSSECQRLEDVPGGRGQHPPHTGMTFWPRLSSITGTFG